MRGKGIDRAHCFETQEGGPGAAAVAAEKVVAEPLAGGG
jgi:hypothetical protein